MKTYYYYLKLSTNIHMYIIQGYWQIGFDCQMTPDILTTILDATKECCYNVVAMVSDLGGSNRALFNELEVDAEKPWQV